MQLDAKFSEQQVSTNHDLVPSGHSHSFPLSSFQLRVASTIHFGLEQSSKFREGIKLVYDNKCEWCACGTGCSLKVSVHMKTRVQALRLRLVNVSEVWFKKKRKLTSVEVIMDGNFEQSQLKGKWMNYSTCISAELNHSQRHLNVPCPIRRTNWTPEQAAAIELNQCFRRPAEYL